MLVVAAVFPPATAVALVGATAYAGQEVNGSITVSPSVVPSGRTIHISGFVSTSVCPASDDVTVTGVSALFPPDGFGPTVARDARGKFALDYTIPMSTPAGRYEAGLRCGGGNPGVAAAVTVSESSDAVEPGAGGIARGWVALWAAAAIAFLLIVTAIVLRRRSARHRS